jgi:hypothetical protein
MFVANVFGKEEINQAAQAIGCKAGEAIKGKSHYGLPGLVGNTFPIKGQLKVAGAKFDSENKAWIFESWDALQAALASIVK